jgi:multidrug transporter EmrE-like cation transporter
MGSLLPTMLPLAFGAAISPVILIVNVLLLSSTTRPIARSVAYAVGCTIIIVGFGVAGVTVISGVSTAPRDVAAVIHLAVGAISLGFALRALIQGPSPPPCRSTRRSSGRPCRSWRRPSPWRSPT